MKRWFAALTAGVLALVAVVVAAPMLEQATPLNLSVSRFAELPDLLKATDLFAHRVGLKGMLRAKAVSARGDVLATRQSPNLIPNAGETALRDCFGGTGSPTCTPVQNFKYHGIGTSATAAGETDTGCLTELTTVYNPDNTRATGSQTNNGANIYRTVGTNTVDGSAAVTEFCLMSQAATGGGTMWSRVVFSTINLASGDSLQTTYDLTIE